METMGYILNVDDIKRLFVDSYRSGAYKRVHVDRSASMPSINMDMIEKGSSKALGLLYSIRAFREDLKALEALGLSYKELVSGNTNIEYFFLKEQHTLLYKMLMEFIVKDKNEECWKTIENAGVYVFQDNGKFYFKDIENGFICPLQLVPVIENKTTH